MSRRHTDDPARPDGKSENPRGSLRSPQPQTRDDSPEPTGRGGLGFTGQISDVVSGETLGDAFARFLERHQHRFLEIETLVIQVEARVIGRGAVAWTVTAEGRMH